MSLGGHMNTVSVVNLKNHIYTTVIIINIKTYHKQKNTISLNKNLVSFTETHFYKGKEINCF